jgi:hypothetical protein
MKDLTMNNNPSYSNVLIGSRIALAMAMAAGSPVRGQFANPVEKRRTAVARMARMARRCDSIKKRSRQLLDEMRAQNDALTAESEMMNQQRNRNGCDLMASVVARMVEQQVALHSKTEEMLDEMMTYIRGGSAA